MSRGVSNYLFRLFATCSFSSFCGAAALTTIFAFHTQAQTPSYIKNYPPNVYNAGPTVYNVTKDSAGNFYFGTNMGVVVFDGARWQLVNISNHSDVNCLELGPDGRVYVGANGNFGYLQTSPVDGFEYVSISDSIPLENTTFNEVWQIVFLDDFIYFQTYKGIFRWNKKKEIRFNEVEDVFIFKINNQLYGSSYVTGEFGKYVDGNILALESYLTLKKDFVFQIFEHGENQHLMATSESGLFLFNDQSEEISVLESEVSEFLKKNDFYDGLKISPDLYAFGSWEGGLVFMNANGELLQVFNQKTGLHANHIYDMKMGQNNDLWLASSNGISRISLDSLDFFDAVNQSPVGIPLLRKINLSFSNEVTTIFLGDSHISIDNKYRVKSNQIDLHELPASMSLYLSTPGYAGEETSYSVYLDGYDKKWSEWKSEPIKEYTNLPGGSYTFYVRAKKEQSNTLSEISSFDINIYTPWHQSIWTKIVLGIFISLGVFSIIRLMMLRLKSQNIRLENMVNERTQYMIDQQKKLSDLNKNLTLTNKELDNFVYHTSHDLKAPLKSVLGLIDLAKREDKDGTFAPYHDRMESSVLKLEEFISSIIQYSSNSKSEVHVQTIDFNRILDNSLNELQFHEAFDKIDIKQRVSTNGEFYSDEKRIQIIFNNLLSNAVKYYDRKKTDPRISIDIKQENGIANIAIKDNGIGIKPDVQDKVFKMFFRASEKSYGSGLGLYIINETVSKLNGKIALESVEGEYTSFMVELPNMKHLVTI